MIDGDAARGFAFRHADGRPYGARPDAARADGLAKVFSALKYMGFKEKECRTALDAVRSHVGADPEPSAETLIRAALEQLTQRHQPAPELRAERR